MIEVKCNLFDYVGNSDILCITTNGFVKSNGSNVMGRGCAKEASVRWPGMPLLLGQKIQTNGNKVNRLLMQDNTWIYSFPVKPSYCVCSPNNVVRHIRSVFQEGETVPGWACIANKEIIEKSARELLSIVDENNFTRVVIPRPGCGAGELQWKDVKPMLDSILDDRFISVSL